MLHFENFALGQTFALGPRRVTVEDIISFAEEFDPQPFHLDPAAARNSVFGELTASGFHSAALMLRLICDAFLSNSSILGSSGMDEVVWHKPLHAGDTVAGTLKVTGLRTSASRPNMGIMNFEAVLNDQRNTRKVTLKGWFFFGRKPA